MYIIYCQLYVCIWPFVPPRSQSNFFPTRSWPICSWCSPSSFQNRIFLCIILVSCSFMFLQPVLLYMNALSSMIEPVNKCERKINTILIFRRPCISCRCLGVGPPVNPADCHKGRIYLQDYLVYGG